MLWSQVDDALPTGLLSRQDEEMQKLNSQYDSTRNVTAFITFRMVKIITLLVAITLLAVTTFWVGKQSKKL